VPRTPRASDGHQRAIPMAINALVRVRLRAESHGRRHWREAINSVAGLRKSRDSTGRSEMRSSLHQPFTDPESSPGWCRPPPPARGRGPTPEQATDDASINRRGAATLTSVPLRDRPGGEHIEQLGTDPTNVPSESKGSAVETPRAKLRCCTTGCFRTCRASSRLQPLWRTARAQGQDEQTILIGVGATTTSPVDARSLYRSWDICAIG
jgi:hypothetical protein